LMTRRRSQFFLAGLTAAEDRQTLRDAGRMQRAP
jgi:hypothetical protein